jgi:AraC-like DNA-binding protein
MEYIELPAAFCESVPEILVQEYTARQNTWRSRVMLTHYVFSFPSKGVKHIIHSTDSTAVQPGEFLIMRAGNCLMTEHIAPEGLYAAHLLFIHPHLLQGHPALLQQKSNQRAIPFSVFPADAFISSFLQSVSLINGIKNEHLRQQALQLKAQELLYYLLDIYGDKAASIFVPDSPCHSDNQLCRIMENPEALHLNIEELAFLCNMSVSTFKRHFRRIYGISPGKWQQRRLLESALQQLQSKKPSEIYMELGYESLAAFIYAFRRYYGFTPGSVCKAE